MKKNGLFDERNEKKDRRNVKTLSETPARTFVAREEAEE